MTTDDQFEAVRKMVPLALTAAGFAAHDADTILGYADEQRQVAASEIGTDAEEREGAKAVLDALHWNVIMMLVRDGYLRPKDAS